jgi:uncharacterized membrane protein
VDELKGNELDLKSLKRKIIRPVGSQRFIEIDMLRGVAIILMIFGHILWDLDYFGLLPINSGIYSALQSTVPPLFFLLVGMSLIVSKKKAEHNSKIDENIYYKNLVVRGLNIFCLGVCLTIGSLIFIPEKIVFFGVLHCIGLSLVVSTIFLKYRKYVPFFAVSFTFIGWIFMQSLIHNPTLLHLIIGQHSADLWSYTLDYFPMLPWFGLVLLGISIGDQLYEGSSRRFRMPDLSKYKPVKIFQWCGQHSLGLYLLHQPVIAGALSVYLLI